MNQTAVLDFQAEKGVIKTKLTIDNDIAKWNLKNILCGWIILVVNVTEDLCHVLVR